ncbi:MAG: DUF4917 domain-containing protein [Planctomycetota bacterium]|nr:MAG: DUF4917 domain-containing protein [Planctomycetota bacterium]
MTKVVNFKQALEESGHRKRHLLLGNGFSMACNKEVFAYSQLLKNADFDGLSPNAHKCFEVLETQDFETVMSALRTTTKLVKLYGSDKSVTKTMQEDATALREVLVQAISSSHPARPTDVSKDSYAACRSFMDKFDRIYSLNYDLLLYWAVMQDDSAVRKGGRNDGFSSDSDTNPWVVWDQLNHNHNQNLFYLHGALHIYDAGHEVQKCTWSRTKIALIDQIREAMKEDKFPIFVAEGESEAKLARIMHHGYLHRSLRSFSNITGCLFIYGHSLAESDEHILNRIEQGKVKDVWVSIYGDPTTQANLRVIERAQRMERARGRTAPLKVHFFSAETAKVWG